MKFLPAVFFIAILLPIPVLAAAPVTHGTCRSGDAGFFKDEALAVKVSTRLQFTKALMREKIGVKSSGRVVTLYGNVSATNLVTLAGKTAADVEGVTCVNNFLKVGPPDIPLPGGNG